MRLFNALQIVTAFVAWPYLLQWLSVATFAMSGIAFWTAGILYFIGFIGVTASIYGHLSWDW